MSATIPRAAPEIARSASVIVVDPTAETDEPEPGPDDAVRAIIADDDPFARKMIKDALQRAGVIVIAEAHNGRQAVDLTRHYRPDVVLMDVVMPELDGIEATRRIVKENPGQIVVILTTADDDEIGLHARGVRDLRFTPDAARPRSARRP